jgi:hypothetical protein
MGITVGEGLPVGQDEEEEHSDKGDPEPA